MASTVPRLTPGSTFAERFRIVGFLGQGSMGSVYRAEPLTGGASLALKIVNLAANEDPRALHRFEREAESGTRIDSPHVARTLAAGRSGGLAWIAMELADGETLTELVQRSGALELGQARAVLEQLFEALSRAHAVGFVHRDLKPDNVRLAHGDDGWHLKVLDFGIAKDFGVDTFSGTTPGLGTPLWTAPEQGREGYRPVPNADVWALGLVTFFVLTGRLYWRHTGERASMADLAVELLKSELEPASERAAELGVDRALPDGFDAWFARAVVREPSQRFSSAEEAWRGLAPLLLPKGAPTQRPSLVVRPGSFLTLVIMSVVLAGLAIYWLLRSMHI